MAVAAENPEITAPHYPAEPNLDAVAPAVPKRREIFERGEYHQPSPASKYSRFRAAECTHLQPLIHTGPILPARLPVFTSVGRRWIGEKTAMSECCGGVVCNTQARIGLRIGLDAIAIRDHVERTLTIGKCQIDGQWGRAARLARGRVMHELSTPQGRA